MFIFTAPFSAVDAKAFSATFFRLCTIFNFLLQRFFGCERFSEEKCNEFSVVNDFQTIIGNKIVHTRKIVAVGCRKIAHTRKIIATPERICLNNGTLFSKRGCEKLSFFHNPDA